MRSWVRAIVMRGVGMMSHHDDKPLYGVKFVKFASTSYPLPA